MAAIAHVPETPDRAGRRVLVAQSDPGASSSVAEALRASGYAAEIARDGDEAHRLTVESRFDLVILDLALPGRSGFQLLRELRARGEAVPVVVVTRHPELQEVVSFLDVAADDYLTEPVLVDELLQRVRAHAPQRGSGLDAN